MTTTMQTAQISKPGGVLGQMTQDTYGKPYLHTFLAFINI
jgi:hypothetical protein